MPNGRRVDAFVAVGSNIEPARNVPAALDLLLQEVRVKAVSTMYRAAPVDRPGQPPFVNGVWRIETDRTARDLKYAVLREIERRLGRVRTDDACAARPIDLDIALFGNAVIEEPDLVCPDPDIRRRPFLSVPLAELAPDLPLPGTDGRLADLPVCRDTQGLEPLPHLTDQLRRRIAR